MSSAALPLFAGGDGPGQPSLLYVPGATPGSTQWKAERLQVVNWGGFEGRVAFDFHSGATLISGASGTGKSTMLDAYTALMMDSSTPFNGASNDNVRGRARSAEQRNLLSYLRGQTDTTIDENTGRNTPKTLRGNTSATWGAVSMTFINDHRERFTALRVYWVPANVTESNGVTTRMLTYDGRLDLRDLQAHIASRFAPKQLEQAFPGMRNHATYQAFSTTLFSRLGIGGPGDGTKALKLLTWIQSGHQIRTVDELFKGMVLERPETFAQADLAIEHFNDLESGYEALVTEQQKAELLAPITDAWEARERARAEIGTIDLFGLTSPGDSPFTLWALQTHERLLEAAEDANRSAREQTQMELSTAEKLRDSLTDEQNAARTDALGAGGSRVLQLEGQVGRREQEVERRDSARAVLAAQMLHLGTVIDDEATFARLLGEGDAFTRSLAEAKGALEEQRSQVDRTSYAAQDRLRVIREERKSYEGRDGRVDPSLNAARDEMAAAAGLTREQVPFVAELIDLDPAQEMWRTAAEAVLGGAARTILVPAEHLEHFSRSIDSHRIHRRVTFEAVPSHPHDPDLGAGDDPAVLVGKLRFKDSPYSHWVHEHLSASSRNPLCVTDPAELGGGGHRVLPSGQTRSGRTRGSHGINAGSRNIIGFSNTSAIAELDAEKVALEKQLKPAQEDRVRLTEMLGELDKRDKAYTALKFYTWDQIDVAGARAAVDATRAQLDDLLNDNDQLRALQAHIDQLDGKIKVASDDVGEAKGRLKALKETHEKVVSAKDKVVRNLEQIEDAGQVILMPNQVERLDREFADVCAPDDPSDISQFLANRDRLLAKLKQNLDRAKKDLAEYTKTIEGIFRAFQLKWPDPSRGTSIESFRDYQSILDAIVAQGLHERRKAWRSRLALWSSQDLVLLAHTMDSSIADIIERMGPVNRILDQLPFGPNGDRLSIKLRRLHPEHVTKFRRNLNLLAQAGTRGLEEKDVEKRFKQLQAFMALLRKDTDVRSKGVSDRDRLLDVRKHVTISAERRDVGGRVLATLDSLGGKSGGESQELIAFIVGAALRFRLGDEENSRPTFAPVFLDEGFVKSDARYTGRAVQAWKGLGFQLIVGAPLEKVSGLEPHMDHLLAITKNQQTGYSFTHPLNDPAAAARAKAEQEAQQEAQQHATDTPTGAPGAPEDAPEDAPDQAPTDADGWPAPAVDGATGVEGRADSDQPAAGKVDEQQDEEQEEQQQPGEDPG